MEHTMQSNKSERATTTTIHLGPLSFEGLHLPEGVVQGERFGVGVSQVAELFSLLPNNATREVKRLTGMDGPLLRLRSDLNSQPVNILTLGQFHYVLVKLAHAGNPTAQHLNLSLTALALEQLFCDAFNIKFEKAERGLFLLVRTESKTLFHNLADQIKIWIGGRTCSQPEYMYYATAFDAINRGCFGKTSKQIRTELGIGDAPLIRDYFSPRALTNLNVVQTGAAAELRRKPHLAPTDAVRSSIEYNDIKPIAFR